MELGDIFGGMYGPMDPALGLTIAQNPEAIIPQLVQQGVTPPANVSPSPGVMLGGAMPGGGGGWGEDNPLAVPTEGGLPPGPRVRGYNLGQATGQMPAGRGAGVPGAIQPPAALGATPYPFGLGSPLNVPPPSLPNLRGATAADAEQGYDPGTPRPEPANVPRPPQRPVDLGERVAGGIRGVGPTEGSPQARPGGNPQQQQQDLLKTLAGVRAPAAPTPQRVSTPSIPRPPAAAQNTQLAALLTSIMGASPQQVNPLYLGSALGGGRVR